MIGVRKYVSFREEVQVEAGRPADGEPLIRVAVAAVVANPSPGLFQEDVSSNAPLSVEVGRELTARALKLLGDAGVVSYGKGAIVGEAGDQEQAVSFLTTAFGDTLRNAVGGTEWVSSVTKRGGPGTSIDIPLASKDFLQARAFYDAVTIVVPDAPRSDEIVLVIGVASRARLNERSGGLTLTDKPA
jgi:Amino acid synthesis